MSEPYAPLDPAVMAADAPAPEPEDADLSPAEENAAAEDVAPPAEPAAPDLGEPPVAHDGVRLFEANVSPAPEPEAAPVEE